MIECENCGSTDAVIDCAVKIHSVTENFKTPDSIYETFQKYDSYCPNCGNYVGVNVSIDWSVAVLIPKEILAKIETITKFEDGKYVLPYRDYLNIVKFAKKLTFSLDSGDAKVALIKLNS